MTASHPPLDALVEAMHTWRTAHPRATLAEMEAEASRQLAAVRRDLIAAVLTPDGPEAVPICPVCQKPAVRNGSSSRTVVTDHGAPLPITTPRYRCSVCGTELSPPQ